MHNLDSLLREALRDEVTDVEPRHLLPDILAAARRCEPALIALIAALQLTVLVVAVALVTQYDTSPAAVPTPRPQPAPTAPGGNP